EPSSDCRYHGASDTSAEKRASRHVVARHGFAGTHTHRLPPFGVVESIAMTPNTHWAAPGAHSMVLSARSSNDGGMVSPIAFAVLRLMIRSNLVGCSTGRSAGFAPFRILSTNVAERRSRSRESAP